jgi:hypothetical protein
LIQNSSIVHDFQPILSFGAAISLLWLQKAKQFPPYKGRQSICVNLTADLAESIAERQEVLFWETYSMTIGGVKVSLGGG